MSRIAVRELRRPRGLRPRPGRRAARLELPGPPASRHGRSPDRSGHVGGMTAGAFEGREMVGFVHGLPRTNLSEPCHHSHMLAVRPEWRGRDVSVRLKLFQRSWCLARGIRLVTWTYDPLLLKNARLNLVRLRARARGLSARPLRHARRPLREPPDGPLRGALAVECPGGAAGVARPAARRASTRRRTFPAQRPRRIPAARRVAVNVPAGAPELYSTHPEAARRAPAPPAADRDPPLRPGLRGDGGRGSETAAPGTSSSAPDPGQSLLQRLMRTIAVHCRRLLCRCRPAATARRVDLQQRMMHPPANSGTREARRGS